MVVIRLRPLICITNAQCVNDGIGYVAKAIFQTIGHAKVSIVPKGENSKVAARLTMYAKVAEEAPRLSRTTQNMPKQINHNSHRL